jgi:coenzyme F420-reducing hydrogenase alpha subunit
VSQIRAALDALGITRKQAAPAPGSALAAHLASCDGDVLLPLAAEQSFLSASDDHDVVTRLLADGAAYSDAPELNGRVPETGIWARRMKREPVPPPGAVPSERLKARIAEAAQLCAWLENEETTREDNVVESYRLGPGTGAAAVECARGRLYHAVELDDDRIVRFEFLAPTEWNFHARGPLVRSLKGSTLASGRQGQDAVRTLIGSFDPCVGFSLSFHETGHA